jgi:hypothetical protein
VGKLVLLRIALPTTREMMLSKATAALCNVTRIMFAMRAGRARRDVESKARRVFAKLS